MLLHTLSRSPRRRACPAGDELRCSGVLAFPCFIEVTDEQCLHSDLCHVADSCGGTFCVPGCLSRGLCWRPEPDPMLDPDPPHLSTPLLSTLPLSTPAGTADRCIACSPPGQRSHRPGSAGSSSLGHRHEHPGLCGTRWFSGGCQVGLARPLTDAFRLGAQSGSARPPFLGLLC